MRSAFPFIVGAVAAASCASPPAARDVFVAAERAAKAAAMAELEAAKVHAADADARLEAELAAATRGRCVFYFDPDRRSPRDR